MSVSELCDLLADLKGLSPSLLSTYQSRVRENNISGLVLTMCDLVDLRPVLDMKFGDWQLFRSAVTSLLEHECRTEQDQKDTVAPVTLQGRTGSDTGKVGSQSDSPSGTDTFNSSSFLIPSSTRPAGVQGPQFNRSISVQEGKSVGSKPWGKVGGMGEGESTGIPENELEKIRQRRMQRNDSIVQQLSYETAILKSAVSGFVEESEEEEESEGEGEVNGKEEAVVDSGAAGAASINTTQVEVHEKERRKSVDSHAPLEGNQGKPVFFVGNSLGSPDKSPDASDKTKSPTMSIQSQFSYDQFSNNESRDVSQPQSSDQVLLLHNTRESSASVSGTASSSFATAPPGTKLSSQRKPMSLSDISPFIQVLDGPTQTSTEFVPQLGSIQLVQGPSTSSAGSGEFVPSSSDRTFLLSDSNSQISASQITSQSASVLDTHSSMVIPSDHQSFPTQNFPEHFLPPEQPDTMKAATINPANIAAFDGNQVVKQSDSKSITETSPPSQRHFQRLSTSMEWLSRPLTNLRQHFQSGSQDHQHNLLSESGAPGPASQHDDLVQQSYSTIVEMSVAAAASDSNDSASNFHHRLGVAFARVDELPSSPVSSPDRETNV